MEHPRYIVWENCRDFWICATLAAAVECKAKHGGVIYEPLGMTAAEKPTSIQEALEKCKEWRLTDEEVEKLLE